MVTNKELLYSTGNSALAACVGEQLGRMDTCVCTAESLCCPPETITLLIGDTPIYN